MDLEAVRELWARSTQKPPQDLAFWSHLLYVNPCSPPADFRIDIEHENSRLAWLALAQWSAHLASNTTEFCIQEVRRMNDAEIFYRRRVQSPWLLAYDVVSAIPFRFWRWLKSLSFERIFTLQQRIQSQASELTFEGAKKYILEIWHDDLVYKWLLRPAKRRLKAIRNLKRSYALWIGKLTADGGLFNQDVLIGHATKKQPEGTGLRKTYSGLSIADMLLGAETERTISDEALVDALKLGVGRTLRVIKASLHQCGSLTQKKASYNVEQQLEVLNELSPVLDAEVPIMLRDAITYIQQAQFMLGSLKKQKNDRWYSPPSHFQQTWLSRWLAIYAMVKVFRSLETKWESIVAFASEARVTISKFMIDWIWEPSIRIYKTIRHEDSLKLTSSAASLDADRAALDRMIVESIKDFKLQPPSEPQQVSLAWLLPIYESSLKSPVSSVVVPPHPLLRFMLIQLHKSKLDMEMTLLSLDKLLKSNELGFSLLAIVPSLLALWLAAKTVRSAWRLIWIGLLSDESTVRVLYQCHALKSLHELERLTSNASDSLSYETVGSIIIALEDLRFAASMLMHASTHETRHQGHSVLMNRMRRIEQMCPWLWPAFVEDLNVLRQLSMGSDKERQHASKVVQRLYRLLEVEKGIH